MLRQWIKIFVINLLVAIIMNETMIFVILACFPRETFFKLFYFKDRSLMAYRAAQGNSFKLIKVFITTQNLLFSMELLEAIVYQ
jgi:hypothetical protein